MIMSLGSCIHAEIIASFCFMPWEYAEMGCARSSVSPNISAYLCMRSRRSSAPTPKISAIKFRYFIPVIYS